MLATVEIIRIFLKAGIEAIVQVALEELPLQPPRELVYLRFPLSDGGCNHAELINLAIIGGGKLDPVASSNPDLLRGRHEPVACHCRGRPGRCQPRDARVQPESCRSVSSRRCFSGSLVRDSGGLVLPDWRLRNKRKTESLSSRWPWEIVADTALFRIRRLPSSLAASWCL